MQLPANNMAMGGQDQWSLREGGGLICGDKPELGTSKLASNSPQKSCSSRVVQ